MFGKYFDKIAKDLLKKPKASHKGQAKEKTTEKSAKKSIKAETVDIDALKEKLNKIISPRLIVDSVKMIDPSGYSPDDVDLVAYKELYRDIINIMGGHIPCELVYGTYHVSSMLNKDTLNDLLRKVLRAKKINRYSDRENMPVVIPAFAIAYDSGFSLPDLKSVLINNYMSMSIESVFEVDIIAILNKGLVIKNWRDKRSYIALETGKDTFMWFFILMNEYLDVDKDKEFDLRNYVQHAEKYNEY